MFYFIIKGEDKQDLEKLQEKMERSKFFKNSESGMAITEIKEEDD